MRSDWRERVKVIRPDLLELQARRNGITRVEVAQALESSFEGRVVGFYREPGYAGTGVFPQETRLLPIVARPPLAEREDVAAINSLQIWSPVAGRMIPLKPGHVRRRGRLGRSGRDAPRSLPDAHRPRRPAVRLAQPVVQSRAVARSSRSSCRRAIRSQWGGEYEDSGRPAPPWPSRSPSCWRSWCSSSCACSIRFRTTLLIWLIMPLAIIGVTSGLLLTACRSGSWPCWRARPGRRADQEPDRRPEQDSHRDRTRGSRPIRRILDGGTSKMRPVCMVVITTVLGMIPLVTDPFFGRWRCASCSGCRSPPSCP